MSSEDRLTRALGGSAAPTRDAGFVFAVLKAGEQARWRDGVIRSVLKAGAFAAPAGLLVGAVADPALFQAGLLTLAGLAIGLCLPRALGFRAGRP
jgi:hypothetical protein